MKGIASIAEGVTPRGLVEHLSREARFKLACLVVAKVSEQLESGEKRGRGRLGWRKAVAEKLKVSPLTISHWLDQQYQGSDVSSGKLLTLALSLDESKTKAIIREDLREHRDRLSKMLEELK